MTLFSRVQLVVIRAAKPYWSYAPTSDEGAAKYGGRFNAVGMHALYTSFSLTTCAREVRFSLNTDPYTFFYLDIDCADIVDLTNQTVRVSLGVNIEDLQSPNWESELHRGIKPASHALSERLIKAGCAGIIVPSFADGAAPEDVNLVLWQWTDDTGAPKRGSHSVVVVSRDALPRDNRSWKPA